ncbi:MAG: peptidase [Microvirga sp.]|nr:peptidase [Microvirga sp.]
MPPVGLRLNAIKQEAFAWVNDHHDGLSRDHQVIWSYAEPSWREYRSARWFVERLRREGFSVEAGSGGMPTAFVASWTAPGSGPDAPVIGCYAEYDAVPGMSQAAVPYKTPREGSNKYAAGHTDPHSALGIGSLGGILATKAVMEAHDIKGTLRLFGEPAEKMCGSKPVHAAHGYYDGIDAFIAYHPTAIGSLANTCIWDTHCGRGTRGRSATQNSHSVSRAPGAVDAVCLMYASSKFTKENMLPHHGSWSLSEAILTAGQATADNLAPGVGQIQYSCRAPQLDMVEQVFEILDANADHAASIAHCSVTKTWITKTRPGLANHALAEIAYNNLALVGAPQYCEDAKSFARQIQTTLGLTPMDEPFQAAISELVTPQEAEGILRAYLPPWQKNYTSDDYTEYTWHAPTVRLFVGRAMLQPPQPDYIYPDWVRMALAGYPSAIDPTWDIGARAIAGTLIDLLTDDTHLKRCKAEFEARTEGGVGGKKWLPPLLPGDFDAPIHFRWPEYVTTERGSNEWMIPNPPNEHLR